MLESSIVQPIGPRKVGHKVKTERRDARALASDSGGADRCRLELKYADRRRGFLRSVSTARVSGGIEMSDGDKTGPTPQPASG